MGMIKKSIVVGMWMLMQNVFAYDPASDLEREYLLSLYHDTEHIAVGEDRARRVSEVDGSQFSSQAGQSGQVSEGESGDGSTLLSFTSQLF